MVATKATKLSPYQSHAGSSLVPKNPCVCGRACLPTPWQQRHFQRLSRERMFMALGATPTPKIYNKSPGSLDSSPTLYDCVSQEIA